MLISPQKKIAFVHIQKNGGKTVESLLAAQLPDLQKIVGPHSQARQGKALLPDWDSYFKFAFVRNPWDRLVSWYSMLKKGQKMSIVDVLQTPAEWKNFLGLWRGKRPHWRYVLQHSASFDEFIKNCGADIEISPGVFASIYRNQLDYLTDEHGAMIVDFVGRFETFSADLTEAFQRMGLPIEEIPQKNTTKHKHYSAYYTPETRDLVAQIYARDIATFGYNFETPAPQ